MKLCSLILFFFFNSNTCLAQQSMDNKEHINILADFIKKSVRFNSEIEAFFAIKSDAEREYYIVEKIVPADSTRRATLDTRIIKDAARQSINRKKGASHFICQISSREDSLFVCEIYNLTNKTIKTSPSLFCNFKMVYSIDSCNKVAIVQFDRRIVM